METGMVTGEYDNPNHPIPRFQRRFWAGSQYPVARALQEGNRAGVANLRNSHKPRTLSGEPEDFSAV